MNKTQTYLLEQWNKNHWPFFGLKQTKFIIGESFDEDIKELRKKEMIEPVAGLNGWLIKIINWETKWNNSQSKS